MQPKTSSKLNINSLAIARTRAAEDAPYLASALWSLVPVAKAGIGTLACDKYWRLYYDPDLDWTSAELSAVLQHEVWHLLRSHHGRCEDLNAEPRKFNVAGDLEINDDLRHTALPKGCIYPDTFGLDDGLMAEEYYEKLPKGQDGDGKGGNGKDGEPKPGGGDCGSCSGNKPLPFEEPGPSQQGKDGAKTPPGIDHAEGELIARDVAKKIKESKGRGTVPGGMQAWAEQILNPKVDWHKELPACLRHAREDKAGMVDWSYSRASRRQAGSKIILPSMREPEVNMAIVVDTSGSMSDDQLSQCLGEVKGCIRAAGFSAVPVISCDAAVHGTQKVTSAKKVQLKGRGGTDMSVGIEAAALLKPRPDIILILTDCQTPWPEQAPEARIVIGWVHSKGDTYKPEVPKYAKLVDIEMD